MPSIISAYFNISNIRVPQKWLWQHWKRWHI